MAAHRRLCDYISAHIYNLNIGLYYVTIAQICERYEALGARITLTTHDIRFEIKTDPIRNSCKSNPIIFEVFPVIQELIRF